MPAKIHNQACEEWHKFLEKQLSDCWACQHSGVQDDGHTVCPVRYVNGEIVPTSPQMYGKIAWVCSQCVKVHVWDLIEGGAIKALCEKQPPGFSVLPDITILNGKDEPTAFIEFRNTHRSVGSKPVAERLGIPLFVVDVRRTLVEFQLGLQNPRRGMWKAVADADAAQGIVASEEQLKSYAWADESSYRFMKSAYGDRDGSLASSFCAIPDGKGGLADMVFHAVGHSPSLPMPSIGPYLLASWSSLECDSQKRWLAGEGPAESL